MYPLFSVCLASAPVQTVVCLPAINIGEKRNTELQQHEHAKVSQRCQAFKPGPFLCTAQMCQTNPQMMTNYLGDPRFQEAFSVGLGINMMSPEAARANGAGPAGMDAEEDDDMPPLVGSQAIRDICHECTGCLLTTAAPTHTHTHTHSHTHTHTHTHTPHPPHHNPNHPVCFMSWVFAPRPRSFPASSQGMPTCALRMHPPPPPPPPPRGGAGSRPYVNSSMVSELI